MLNRNIVDFCLKKIYRVLQKIMAMKICTVQNSVEWRARLLLSASVRKQKIVACKKNVECALD
jgi:hypothetical protein